MRNADAVPIINAPPPEPGSDEEPEEIDDVPHRPPRLAIVPRVLPSMEWKRCKVEIGNVENTDRWYARLTSTKLQVCGAPATGNLGQFQAAKPMKNICVSDYSLEDMTKKDLPK